jgi:hypothetical protein
VSREKTSKKLKVKRKKLRYPAEAQRRRGEKKVKVKRGKNINRG